jgi:hypothetical protein
MQGLPGVGQVLTGTAQVAGYERQVQVAPTLAGLVAALLVERQRLGQVGAGVVVGAEPELGMADVAVQVGLASMPGS